jgi:hypothetical protein
MKNYVKNIKILNLSKLSKIHSYLFLFIIIILAIIGGVYFKTFGLEGFTSYPTTSVLGEYPSSEQGGILPGSMFPLTNNKGVSDKSGKDIWKEYPITTVGSYAQTTNNIRYPKNPDDGTSMPAEFSNTFYNNAVKTPSAIITPLGPVKDCPGARVNYYHTQPDLLPYSNTGNILY